MLPSSSIGFMSFVFLSVKVAGFGDATTLSLPFLLLTALSRNEIEAPFLMEQSSVYASHSYNLKPNSIRPVLDYSRFTTSV
ncbi:hypothetical protein BDY24DRAFT_374749 [Mrakia frigida]|uniref:uncharacterized protein n=1 Tax=Mrakia frigida TaxID=29902 RepID=UPI003FCC188A